MSELTTDKNDPRLGHGSDAEPVPQNEAYLVLSKEERAKGFVRPYRDTYIHTGQRPKFPLRELTPEEHERYDKYGYTHYEEYPPGEPCVGRFWTEAQLQTGCGARTTMARELAETYAREPGFYGSTYCATCRMHRPVAEFTWEDGQQVGS